MDLTAAGLLANDLCTAQCLLSAGRESAACLCPCRGRFHGALTRTLVPGSGAALPPPTPPTGGQTDALAWLSSCATGEDL
jgi:hypothetical protein